jgi:uncharacterized protein (DUF305 family)
MKLKYWVATAVLAISAGGGAYAQAGHQGHDTKAKGQHAGDHTTHMPALTDAQFVQMMIKHHKDGIELSKIEESRGREPAVKSLAAKMRQAQERDIAEMQSSHAEHAATKPEGTSGHGEHAGQDAAMRKHHEMMEQMAQDARIKVENASEADVDDTFLQTMIKHHEMALQMIEGAKLKDAGLRKMSQKMASEQKREIAEMKKLLRSAGL